MSAYSWMAMVSNKIKQGRPDLGPFIREQISAGLYKIAGDLEWGVINFAPEGDYTGDRMVILPDTPVTSGNGMSSAIRAGKDNRDPESVGDFLGEQHHKIVLDLDCDALLIPSSTPGHHHLIIDHEVSWSKYIAFLKALVEVGLMDQGYLEASLSRHATWIRAPWETKQKTSAHIPSEDEVFDL